MPASRSPDPSRLTFEEWYAKPVVEPLTSSESLSWTDISLHTSRIIATGEYISGPVQDENTLIFTLTGSTRLQSSLQGKFYDEYQLPGSITLVPSNHESYGCWSHSISAAFIQLSPQLITKVASSTFRGDPTHVHILPGVNFHDPLLYHLMTELCAELQHPGPFGALFAESAAHTIMLHLLRKYSTAVLTPPAPHNALTTRQVRVIDDYVESHLDAKISLTDLASLLFMSLSHFERTFRATLGCPPYRYVLQRRIERAKHLLESTNFSLHEIACQTGFANQSHFTRHFTRFASISPARFREHLKN